MKQVHRRIRVNRYTTGIVLLLVAASASAVLVIRHNRADAGSSAEPAVGAGVESQFSFAGASGWWQGATNETSMALFNFDRSDPSDTGSCFTSVEHKAGAVDIEAELQWIQTGLTNDSYTDTPLSKKTLTLQTPSGPRQYELHQSAVTTPSGREKLMGGQEHGYLQLSGSYIKIMGYCSTAEELPDTIPALQAIKFDGAH